MTHSTQVGRWQIFFIEQTNLRDWSFFFNCIPSLHPPELAHSISESTMYQLGFRVSSGTHNYQSSKLAVYRDKADSNSAMKSVVLNWCEDEIGSSKCSSVTSKASHSICEIESRNGCRDLQNKPYVLRFADIFSLANRIYLLLNL